MRTLIKNGNVVTAVDNYSADILIEDGKVSVIGAKLDMEADRVIDASDHLVIPGGIDPHTHMELPFGGTFSSDDFRTGTVAAAHGGTTTTGSQEKKMSAPRRAASRRVTAGGDGAPQLRPVGPT